MAAEITIDQLGTELRRRRDEDQLSLRDVEAVTGVSAATLSRIERGSTPDLSNVSSLAQWLGVVVRTGGAPSHSPSTDADLRRTIEVHLRAEKKLPSSLARSIADAFDLVVRLEMEKAAKKKR